MFKFFLVLANLFLFLKLSVGQSDFNNVSSVATAVYFDVSPPLRDMVNHQIKKTDQTWKQGFVGNYFDIKKPEPRKNFPADYVDPVKQLIYGSLTLDTTLQNFDGETNAQGVAPPDTYGEAGPNHYFQVVNLAFQIFNKSGTSLLGPSLNSSIWTGMSNNENDGDAVVLYDEQADRWVFTQFSLPNYPNSPFYQMIAVSQTPDPTGSWYRWQFSFSSMPDYPKFGVWPDGYYMSANRFSSGSGSFAGVYALAYERSAMLAGSAGARMIQFSLPNTNEAYTILPADCDGVFPPYGTPEYFTYIHTSSPYHLGIIEFHTDWTTPASSTFGNFLCVPVATFSASMTISNGGSIPQSGTNTKLDAITDRLMYRAQFRTFSDHQSMVLNHTVNAGSNVAGIRWYELRRTTGAWSVYQQSTFSPDSKSRWMASMAMDTSGNIALGYSISASSMFPSIRYSGRLRDDPLGLITHAEKGIINGGGSQTGIAPSPDNRSRWGDYSGMSVDPTQPNTFWYTQEYYAATSSWGWKTRVGSFQIGSIAPVADFKANSITPCLENTVIFTDQTYGNPISWSWSITPSTFAYIDGTSSTSQNPHVKFNKYGTYTIALTATNALGNNTKTKSNYISVNTLNADFTASLTTVVSGNPTVFTDASTCNATSWSWNFGSGATPSTASIQGPISVTYSSTGAKNVSLTVNGTTTQTKSSYINVINTPFNMTNATITTCSGNFYDPGGSASNYGNNLDYTETFYPSTPNSNIRFVFSVFALEAETNCYYDYLKIYDGNTTSSPLLGTWCGTNSPGTVTASNATGSLTFVFHSDDGSNLAGWASSISCVSNNLAPVANFSANNILPSIGSTVIFTDQSTNGPSSWIWTFAPNTVSYVDATSGTSPNPHVQFNSNGMYTVSLQAANASGSDTKTKTNYINSGTPGLWTGITSSDWNTASNWSNYVIPTPTTNVSLPSSAPNWPSLTGDLTMGIKCSNLTLAANSVLSSTGNFTVNAGDTLTFNGPATLQVGGDWNDYGIFNSGTGTVEFTGANSGKITGGINKAGYVSNYALSTFAKSMTPLSGATTLTSGDDVSYDVNIGFTFIYLGVSYTQVRVNSNGWASLNLTGIADAVDNSNLFTTALPATALAPWWDDLTTDGQSSLSYKTEGNAPNRVLTLQWYRLFTFYSGTTTARISFQVKLYETSNVIEFCYGSLEAGVHDHGESASIGIKDGTGGPGHFREATTGSTTTGITSLVSTGNWPAVNYRFTSPSSTEVFYNLKESKINSTFTIEPGIIVNGNVILSQ
jgi:PKD repeat protein